MEVTLRIRDKNKIKISLNHLKKDMVKNFIEVSELTASSVQHIHFYLSYIGTKLSRKIFIIYKRG